MSLFKRHTQKYAGTVLGIGDVLDIWAETKTKLLQI